MTLLICLNYIDLISSFLCSGESQFELVDEKVEKLFHFRLKESLCRARKTRLFRVSIEIQWYVQWYPERMSPMVINTTMLIACI